MTGYRRDPRPPTVERIRVPRQRRRPPAVVTSWRKLPRLSLLIRMVADCGQGESTSALSIGALRAVEVEVEAWSCWS